MTELTQNDLNTLERVIDRVFAKIGIDVEFTRHFLDRVNDPRNKQQISMRELGMLFAKEYKKWGRPIAKLGPDAEAVMKDLESDINIPFVLKRKGNQLELVAKTVMRKPNFRTPDREFKVEDAGQEYEDDKFYARFMGEVKGPYASEGDAWRDTGGDVDWINREDRLNGVTEDIYPFQREILVPGLGTYNVDVLQKNLGRKLEDLAKKAQSGDPYAFRQIARLLKDPAFNAMLEALIKTYDKLATQTQHRKQFGEGDMHGAKKGSQVKGKEKTPSKTKPSTTGSTPHPYRGRLVGEAAMKELWEEFQTTDEAFDPREAIMKKALAYLDKMVRDDTQKRHTVGGHAMHVLQAFKMPDLDPRSFARLYLNWKNTGQLTEGWLEENLYYIDEALDQDEDQTDS